MIRLLVLVFGIMWAMPAVANNVVVVQKQLKSRGYEVGKVDGKFGKQTAGAIERYQSDWNLPLTGKITKDLVVRLTRQHADTKAQMQKVDNSDCEIWNSFPHPRETITFAACKSAGPANAKGEVIWKWFEHGDWQSARYEGEYRNGKMNGRGVLHYPNGHRYEGDFVDDKRHGTGVHEWARGDVYEGQWQDGKPHGSGTYTKGDQQFAGTWRKGCFSQGKRRARIDTSKKTCGFR